MLLFKYQKFIRVSRGLKNMAFDVKKAAKRTWHFIWEDDSIWSWIVNLILAFIIIKYIIFPVLAFFLGSSFPVVAVVSGSMHHDSDFNTWWNSQAICSGKICTQGNFYGQFNISENEFMKFKFANGFNIGDVMILTAPKDVHVGDVLVYVAANGEPIIHRVISLDPLETKGDHNEAQIVTASVNEQTVSHDVILGKASFDVPLIGYVKIWFADIMSLFGVTVR